MGQPCLRLIRSELPRRSLLFETRPFDPAVYLGVAIILLIASAAACWLPARRASGVDVVRLLRAN
jgi:hypothetical protein